MLGTDQLSSGEGDTPQRQPEPGTCAPHALCISHVLGAKSEETNARIYR